MDKAAFLTNIYLYLLLSVGVGFFGGLRTLCFNIIGRKMSNNITVELFENMVFQDIAYFDGLLLAFHVCYLPVLLSNPFAFPGCPFTCVLAGFLISWKNNVSYAYYF